MIVKVTAVFMVIDNEGKKTIVELEGYHDATLKFDETSINDIYKEAKATVKANSPEGYIVTDVSVENMKRMGEDG